MNCLQYALKFWNEHPDYRIHYNSEHCINLPPNSLATGFLPAERFGYNYFSGAFNEILTEEDLVLLRKYFNIVL
jgi:hypothetical protein